MLQDRADKICEMANVMQKSIQIDEENMAKEQELMARLVTENKVSPNESTYPRRSVILTTIISTPLSQVGKILKYFSKGCTGIGFRYG